MTLPPLDDMDDINIVFSQSCNQQNRIQQQSMLQTSVAAVGQRGPITQILSDAQRAAVMAEPILYPNFRRHFTPSYYSHPEPGVDDWYTPYNKPFSLRHFLNASSAELTNKYLALIDGDFVFFHRLQVNTGRNVSRFFWGTRDPRDATDTVADGTGAAMSWSVWRELVYLKEADKRVGMCGGDGTDELPCARIPADEAMEYYGDLASPYIMTTHDWRKLIDDYCHFTVLGRKLSDKWVVEMEAFTVAAANNDIRFTRLFNYAISYPPWRTPEEEYWTFVDDIPDGVNPCNNATGIVGPGPGQPPLYFLHYFHHFRYGKYDFFKKSLPKNLHNCSTPLLQLPPAEQWLEASNSGRREQRHMWAHCSLVKAMNEAMRQYKKQACVTGFNTYEGVPMLSVTAK